MGKFAFLIKFRDVCHKKWEIVLNFYEMKAGKYVFLTSVFVLFDE